MRGHKGNPRRTHSKNRPLAVFPSPDNQYLSSDINEIMLADTGYSFDEYGVLIHIETGNTYVHESDRKFDLIADYAVLYVQCKLKDLFGLQELWLPADNANQVNVFITPDFFDNIEKCLVIIQGAGEVRAGVWARSVCINDHLDAGSMFQYIAQAIDLQYSVIIFNPNFNRNPTTMEPIPGNDSGTNHSKFVWNELVRKSPARNVMIIAHSKGGIHTVELIDTFGIIFMKRVKGIALIDSVHKTVDALKYDAKMYFRRVAVNWAKTTSSLGTLLYRAEVARNGCLNLSAGHKDHVYTSSTAFPEIFPYLESKIVNSRIKK